MERADKGALCFQAIEGRAAKREGICHDMLTDDTLTSVTGWRQRIAGGLLIVGGAIFIASYFLPWQYAYWPPAECPSCGDQMRAPADGFLNIFAPLWAPEAVFLDAVSLAILIGLPLALAALGVRLLVRRQPVRLRRKVLVIVAGILGICAAYLFTVVIAARYAGLGPPELRDEIGKYLAFLASLAVLAAGSVMPTKRHRMVS